MRAGQLSDLLTFEKKVITYVGDVRSETWYFDFEDWGEAERLTEQNCRFTIRYRDDIAPDDHRIVFFNAYWTLTNVLPDRRHSMLTIDSDFSALLEVTTMQSEVREYIEGLPVIRPRAVAPTALSAPAVSVFGSVINLTVDTAILDTMRNRMLVCSGTHSHTIPPATGRTGYSFYFVNDDIGIITIVGTINGDPSGYQLVNKYQFVEITSDGTNWLITNSN